MAALCGGVVAWAGNASSAAAQDMPGMPGMPGMAGHVMDGPATAPSAVPATATRPEVRPFAGLPPGNGTAGGPTAPMTGAMMGHQPYSGAILVSQLEYRAANQADIGVWEGQGYYGTDYDRVWVNTRGEYNSRGRALERAEVQLLYSHLVSYFWNLQGGIRQDLPIRPRAGTPARTHAVIGYQGLAPGLFEVNLQGFVNERGVLAARVEASYDLYVTQRLVLQPQLELNAAANNDLGARLGSGFTRFETGLRLRYEFSREVAPYVGLVFERVLGETAGIYRRTHEDRAIRAVVAGVRLFF